MSAPTASPHADPPASLRVRPVSEEQHLALIRSRRSASFLQTPAWGPVKSEWRRQSVGWFRPAGDGDAEELVGAALVLYRQLPKVKRFLAYVPEGPVIDWTDGDPVAWLDPLAAHVKAEGAFGLRIGPPVALRRWDAAAIKDGIKDEAVTTLGQLAPRERSAEGARLVARLRERGWRPQATEGGFAAGQPQYVFQLPLRDPGGEPRSEEDVLAGMNQQWRRNIRKADKAGVETSLGDGGDLESFHELYLHTAERDGFTPRPLSYFRTMYDALSAEEPDRIRLHLARHEGDLVAATLAIRVGAHTWYSYGASSSEKREVQASNAVQWAMITDALEAGSDVYDLRGITDTLHEDDPHLGLIRFKVGTGGEAVEYAGEWDLPLNRALYAAFSAYMARRARG